MVLEAAWRLGIGVALAWAALPWLAKLARRSRSAPPAQYYRALVTALFIATALIVAPLVRGGSGSPFSLLTLEANSDGAQPSSVAFVVELVRPLIGASRSAWSSTPLARCLAAVGGIWLLLFAAGVARSIAGYLRLCREYEQAVDAPARVLAHAERIALELGVRTPPIRVADGPAAAFTYGAFAPVVVLGVHACALRDDDLGFVLRHELWHVARHDSRTMCWIDLAQRCFAGHPSLRVLAAEIRVAREARADALAAGTRRLEYAQFLVTIAEHIHSVRAPSAFLVSMADTALERRVDMLIHPNTHRSRLRRSTPWLALVGLNLGGLVFLTPASWGQPERTAGDHLTVRGNLSVEQVEKALFSKSQPMLDCYGGLIAPRANLSVQLSFEVDQNGSVSSGSVSASDHRELEPCFHAALMRLSFPRPSSGTVSVQGPTLLTPPYDERLAVLETREGTSQRLPRDVIRANVRSYLPQLRDCFERLNGALPSASVNMRFIIARDGKANDGQTIDKSEPSADSVAFAQLAQCVDDVRRTMQFPAPEDGIVSVDYPVLFEDTPSSSDR